MKKNKMILIVILGIILDRITKIIVKTKIGEGKIIKVIGNFFRITYLKNTGAAWSILEGKQILLILVSIVFLIFLIKVILKDERKTLTNTLAYSFILSGIIGNLIDRIIYRYVIDFLSFKIVNYYFPVFNIADMLIVIGVILFIIDVILEGREESPLEYEYKQIKEKINGKTSSRKR